MVRHRILFLATFLLLACLRASANLGGFYYSNISVEAVVHENNVWDVTEKFDIFFEQPRHGFYRYIPRRFRMKHAVKGEEELKTFPYVCGISHISVDGWEFTTEDSNDEFCIIRIGSADRKVMGNQTYVIKYTFTYPDDRVADKDYLFHTILGTEFEQPIKHLDFTVTFDKALPDVIADQLRVYAGKYGKKNGMIPTLSVKATPTEIAGEASDIAPRHGVTLYADLPEGYYVGARAVDYTWLYAFLALTLLTMLAIAYSQLRQKTPHVTKVIEFYPPEGISSGEVGTIIDGTADDIDITSLIPWLAGQGYIKIKEQKTFGATDLILTKLKDLPSDAPDYQKRLMKLLFAGKDVVSMKDIGEQPTQYHKVMTSLQRHFKGKRELIVYKGAFWLYVLLALFGTLALGANAVVATLDPSMLFAAAAFFGAPCLCASVFKLLTRASDKMHSSIYHLVFFLVRAVLMVATWHFYCLFFDYGVPLDRWDVLPVFVVSFFLNELAGRFSVDTDYRVQMMGCLLGFKEFIETAEKPRLEQLQTDDPQYFYKVLPYAMVFKLSNKWENLFKDIKLEKPDWYDSATPLVNAALAHNMMHSFNSTASQALSTISHNSSSDGGDGGGFSGGGFSGGGGGGGGGGSW